jgi:hypothetical protein
MPRFTLSTKEAGVTTAFAVTVVKELAIPPRRSFSDLETWGRAPRMAGRTLRKMLGARTADG